MMETNSGDDDNQPGPEAQRAMDVTDDPQRAQGQVMHDELTHKRAASKTPSELKAETQRIVNTMERAIGDEHLLNPVGNDIDEDYDELNDATKLVYWDWYDHVLLSQF